MVDKSVTILGSTGTIGKNTLDIIRMHRERFEVRTLTAGSNVELLIDQAKEFGAQHVAIADETKYEQLKTALPDIEVAAGEEAVAEAVFFDGGSEIFISAVTGFAALKPTINAAICGSRIGLANKESLVCAGQLLLDEVNEYGAKIIPIDSEHNAIFQLLNLESSNTVEKVVLTASGGPFRELPLNELENVSIEQAINHPNWKMGRKISVDSATMMNKGLELIEAKYLFGLDASKLDAIIHPESYIHSLVYHKDGSVLAQAAVPDMRVPISYALGYPGRLENNAEKLDLTELGKLHFEKIDFKRYPCLKIAMEAMEEGDAAPIILNAANEIAVDRFLNGQIKFTQIAEVVAEALEKIDNRKIKSLDDVYEMDSYTRKVTEAKLAA